jgi:hypothetical protein
MSRAVTILLYNYGMAAIWVLALLLRIREVPRSNPEPEIDYSEDFRHFPEANSGIVPQIRP